MSLTSRGTPGQLVEQTVNSTRIPTSLFEGSVYEGVTGPDEEATVYDTHAKYSKKMRRELRKKLRAEGKTEKEVKKAVRVLEDDLHEEFQEHVDYTKKRLSIAMGNEYARQHGIPWVEDEGALKRLTMGALTMPTIGMDPTQNPLWHSLPPSMRQEEEKFQAEGMRAGYARQRFHPQNQPGFGGYSIRPLTNLALPREPTPIPRGTQIVSGMRKEAARKKAERDQSKPGTKAERSAAKKEAREEAAKKEAESRNRAAIERKAWQASYRRKSLPSKKNIPPTLESELAQWKLPVPPKGSGRAGSNLAKKIVKEKVIKRKKDTYFLPLKGSRKPAKSSVKSHPAFASGSSSNYHQPRPISDASFIKRKAPPKAVSPDSPGWIETKSKKRKREGSTMGRKSLLDEAIERESKRRRVAAAQKPRKRPKTKITDRGRSLG